MEFISSGVDILGEDVYFNMGGKNEFTFTINGEKPLFHVYPYIIACMPENLKENWIFHPHAQPAGNTNFEMQMNDKRFGVSDILVKPIYEDEEFCVHFYCELLSDVDEDNLLNMCVHLLDLTLGDAISNKYVTDVAIADEKSDDMIPLSELPKHIEKTLENDDKELNDKPGVTIYQWKPEENEELRFDTIAGITMCSELINDYFGESTSTIELFENYGVTPMYIAFAYDSEQHENIVDLRQQMEDEIEEEVFGRPIDADGYTGEEIGRVVGGATGTGTVYIDMIVFDEDEFMKRITEWVKKYDFKIYISEFKQKAELVEL